MTASVQFSVPGSASCAFAVKRVIIAGFTGRDKAAIKGRVAELAEIGVAAPSEVPMFYRVGADLVTQAAVIQTVGNGSSGEVDPALVDDGKRLYLGLASGHADHELETHSIGLAKQVCPKPIAGTLWPFDEVREHLDSIELRSWVCDSANGEWELYQDGTLASILPLTDLIAGSSASAGHDRLEAGTVMLCGTIAAIDGVRPAKYFRMQMHDPVHERTIEHDYEAVFLPLIE